MIELSKYPFEVRQQAPIGVFYEGQQVGEYFADLLVDGCVIVELKAAEALHPDNEAQLLNYLKATDVKVGLLLNFGPKPEVKRKILDLSRPNPKTDSKEIRENPRSEAPRAAGPRPIPTKDFP